MSRASSSTQQRSLTLTEELERLEQSITLTLQEIDHNFSRAHRIVTSSILPIVEQYAQHSRDVWEGSKFWKQFFESSANVSLSGYEEQPSTHDAEETTTDDSNLTTHTTLETSPSYGTPFAQHISTDSIQDIDLSNLTMSPSHSTPRPTKKPKSTIKDAAASFADYPSPYEALRKELNSNSNGSAAPSQAPAPTTPGKPQAVANETRDIAMTPQASPFLPQLSSIPRPSTARKKTDPLLHRVLDRNYRVQATPLAGNRFAGLPAAPYSASKATATPAVAARNKFFESIVSSSPEIAAPKLTAEVFSSPHRDIPIPGVSGLAPGKAQASSETSGTWDRDDGFEDEDTFDLSPPKTMQFHVPQNRLLKTPAKEASKRIVEDLMMSAGIGRDADFADDSDAGVADENSPSVVRKAASFVNESF